MTQRSRGKSGAAYELRLGKCRQFVPRDDLLTAFEGAPVVDYDELRADLDAVADPAPWGWDDWKEWADRHVGGDSPGDR